MDLHVFMPGHDGIPDKKIHDTYGNRERVGWNNRNHRQSGGIQDVDYTDAAPEGYVPVENITFPSLDRLRDGEYICRIHNWALRAPTQGGFRAEIECGGQVYAYEYDKPLANKEWVTVAVATLRKGEWTVAHALPESTQSAELWNVSTMKFHKVNTLMLSPNFWDGQQGIGNKHYFFMLENCRNEGTARGFFNEFLDGRLDKHRKVFEIVGSKMKTDKAEEQLSGLGFSSTKRDHLIVRVSGSFTRTVKVLF